MDEQTSNILELAFLVCLMVIVAMLSIHDVFYVKSHLSEENELTDKTSRTKYSTLIDKELLSKADLEDRILAVVLASDTDKKATVSVDVVFDGVMVDSFEAVGNKLDTVIVDIMNRVESVTGITDQTKYKFELEIGLSLTVITVYVES